MSWRKDLFVVRVRLRLDRDEVTAAFSRSALGSKRGGEVPGAGEAKESLGPRRDVAH